MLKRILAAGVGVWVGAINVPASHAAESALDTVVDRGVLRCGVVLDSPPSGYRNARNEPDGFDVAYCRDMAQVMGVKADIIETPASNRIPALVAKRIDVLIASTTGTPQRGLTIAFSRPYMSYATIIISRRGSGISAFADLADKRLGGVAGTTNEALLKKEMAGSWKGKGATYTAYGGDNEAFLALEEGKVDAILQAVGVFKTLQDSGMFPDFVNAGSVPLNDLVSIGVRRDDVQFLNWVNQFIWSQNVSGRFAQLYRTYFGDGPLPDLSTNTVSP
ncbi:transporter substrate-binding domain-containing protein [Gluconacetobacter asukensis]|uniref:Transporter substrate-binding domain-containing protein n=1 Tax=Gluconacetobacter asukensis TaxID=1017181 RepID=A0A7W4P393_9PROT|nr:transporter substrate-binding domain-containing protein [Gluconacetobacter asukensis]MBB2173728.1 transporter substrate-binding domain-containing protein [Gluconacetobacter asukensis]